MLKRKFEEEFLEMETNIKKMKINKKRKFEEFLEIETNIKKMKINNENYLFSEYVKYKRTILMYL